MMLLEIVTFLGIYVRFLGCKHLRFEMGASRSTTWNTDAKIEHCHVMPKMHNAYTKR